jgi:hypothetical protein
MFSSLPKTDRNGLSVLICAVSMVSVVADAAVAEGAPPTSAALAINVTAATIGAPLTSAPP